MNWSTCLFLACLAISGCLGAQRLDARQLLQQAMMKKQRDLTSDNYVEYSEAASRFRRDEVKIPLTEINEVMSLDDDTTLDVRKTVTTVQGTQLIKMQELYKGRLVSDGVVTLETGEDQHHVIDASGSVYKDIDVSFDDKGDLDAEKALHVCLKHNHDMDLRDQIVHQSVEQQVFFDDEVKAYPAYMVQYLVESGTTQRRPTCIVNARDAHVAMSWDAIDTCTDCEATGTGGNEKIGKIRYGELQRCLNLRRENDVCYLENKYVRVLNNNFSWYSEYDNSSETASYNCKEIDDEVNGAYSPLLDALFYGTVVGKMFEDWYNMTPLDHTIIFRIHFGEYYSNAFWTGLECVFGDGGDMFHPLVSLDIAAHEVGHGVTQKNSDLFYYGQWGGINEAFSDLMGETAEAYLDDADWMTGFDVMKDDFPPIRYFENPEKDNYSISHVDNYTDYLDVHDSSGVYRKVFFLLVQEYDQPIKEVFHVFLHANMLYWHHMSNFEMAACDVMKAAYDRGQDGSNYHKAFSQVGIEACDVQHHILGLRFEHNYTDITVSKDISPNFLLAVPWFSPVCVKAGSSHGDVYIVLSNKTWGKEEDAVYVYAEGLGFAAFENTFDSEFYVSVELSTSSISPLSDVVLLVTYSCEVTQQTTEGDKEVPTEGPDEESKEKNCTDTDDKMQGTWLSSGHVFNFFKSFVIMIFSDKN